MKKKKITPLKGDNESIVEDSILISITYLVIKIASGSPIDLSEIILVSILISIIRTKVGPYIRKII